VFLNGRSSIKCSFWESLENFPLDGIWKAFLHLGQSFSVVLAQIDSRHSLQRECPHGNRSLLSPFNPKHTGHSASFDNSSTKEDEGAAIILSRINMMDLKFRFSNCRLDFSSFHDKNAFSFSKRKF
jgi:hypothetical protein